MSTDLERELRAAFDSEASQLLPSPTLVDQVRSRVRRRRRITGATLAVLLAAGSVTAVLTTHSHPGAGPARLTTSNAHHRLALPLPDAALALGGSTLYVANGDVPDAALAAYDSDTGALLRRVALPAMPASVKVGPGGLVWVSFSPSAAGGRSGIWELSPDLAVRYQVDLTDPRYRRAAPFDILPTGSQRILLASDQGVAAIHVPALGRPGVSTIHWRSLSSDPRQLLPTGLDRLTDGTVVVRFSGDNGDSELVRADDGDRIDPGRGAEIATSRAGLWVTNAGTGHRLRLLDSRLRPLGFDNPLDPAVAGDVESVWSNTNTVFVASDAAPRALVCFAYPSSRGRATATVSIGGANTSVTAVVAGQDTVYVATDHGVTSYPVPAPCQA